MQNKTVSILGCGWLGVPLAQHLLTKGFSVKGSVTSPEKFELLRSVGISTCLLILNEGDIQIDDPEFFNCDVLIVSLPPRRIPDIERIFPAQISQLIPWILNAGIQKVIFISSTSVYPENIAVAREEETASPDKESGKALILAENIFLNQSAFRTTILRFGGLIGADRNPAYFLRKAIQTLPNTPVNLIHQDDCIGIIEAIINRELWGETLNACCPEHPLKKDFYGMAAHISGLPKPLVADQHEHSKIVDSGKLISMLNYRFIYPSPMDYLNSLQSQ
jgi:nucleoside-diphosphate-sugar epimerase